MKVLNILAIGISLFLLTVGTALAGKPVKPPSVDLEALLATETQERVDADNALETAVNDNAQNIDANSSAISSNAADINTNAGNISTNTSGVSTNANDINDNVINIANNASGIQTNANAISSSIVGAVMYLRCKDNLGSSTVNPNACPTDWTEADLKYEQNGLGMNDVRTCYKTDASCQVMYLRSRDDGGYEPNACPTDWSEADYQLEASGYDNMNNLVRTCYICF